MTQEGPWERKRPASHRFITRMDYARTKGWWVRVMSDGEIVAKRLFSDGKHGGKRAALAAAKEWRDAMMKEHNIGGGTTPGGRRFKTKRAGCVSGLVGVSPSVSEYRGRLRVDAWRAGWMGQDGRQRMERFTVADYGYDGAFRRAIEKRSAMIGVTIQVATAPSQRQVLARIARKKEQT